MRFGVCGRLQECSQNHDADAQKDGSSPTERLSHETGKDGAEEASNFVNGHNERDHVGAVVGLGIDSKGIVKGGSIDQTAHEAIVCCVSA